MTNCDKCLNETHEHVCDCGHPHGDHVFAGGCTHKTRQMKPCDCTGYIQKKLRKAA